VSAPRRSRLHEEHEEHENHERWLVTYADMVTLLMVLFIVMFAMSQVDEKKFMALKEGLAAGFANSASVLPGSDTLLEQSGTSPMSPIAPDHRVEDLTKLTVGALDAPRDAQSAEHRAQALDEAKKLGGIAGEVQKALNAQGLADDVTTSIDERGLVISLVSKHVTFRADQATLTPRGAAVVDALGPVLRRLSEDIEVSGHTNQVPVTPRYYATDWDLSAARAVTVLRRLNEQLGLPADRLSVAAYGNTRPLVDPTQPGSQSINKRVDLVVLSSADEQTRALLGQYAGEATAAETTETAEGGAPAEGDQAGEAAAQPGADAEQTIEKGRHS
jgi:chemotaxis protein MotB